MTREEEFFNFDKVIEIERQKIRAEVIEEYKINLLNAKTDLVNDIHKAGVWVEFKRQAIEIAEKLKEQNKWK